MRTTINYCCAGLLLLTSIAITASVLLGSALASDVVTEQRSNVNNSAPQCPDITLHRDVSVEERVSRTVRIDDPLYLSRYYCFAHWADTSLKGYRALPTQYSLGNARSMGTRYHLTFDTLSSDQQRIAFAHLFIKTLTERSMVIPKKVHDTEIEYLLPTRNKGRVELQAFSLVPSVNDFELLHNGLLELAGKPPIDKDWPELVKLVELVLTNLDSQSAQTVDMMDSLAQR